MNSRFRDEGKTLGDFVSEFYVKCPLCGKFVYMKTMPGLSGSSWKHEKQVLSCEYCGYTSTGQFRGSVREPQLWLEANCCGKKLWAYNLKHLEYIEKYVAAGTRQAFVNDRGIFNQSMLSRLPKWLSSGKNREEILNCISKMKKTIPNEYINKL